MGLCILKFWRWAPKTYVFWKRVRNDRSRSSKVVHFSTNRKRVCNFLLVINRPSNLGPILPRIRDIAGFLLRRATPLFHPKFGVFEFCGAALSTCRGVDAWMHYDSYRYTCPLYRKKTLEVRDEFFHFCKCFLRTISNKTFFFRQTSLHATIYYNGIGSWCNCYLKQNITCLVNMRHQ